VAMTRHVVGVALAAAGERQLAQGPASGLQPAAELVEGVVGAVAGGQRLGSAGIRASPSVCSASNTDRIGYRMRRSSVSSPVSASVRVIFFVGTRES
jgi:hypothetical protein